MRIILHRMNHYPNVNTAVISFGDYLIVFLGNFSLGILFEDIIDSLLEFFFFLVYDDWDHFDNFIGHFILIFLVLFGVLIKIFLEESSQCLEITSPDLLKNLIDFLIFFTCVLMLIVFGFVLPFFLVVSFSAFSLHPDTTYYDYKRVTMV